jgi:anti-anti-sigma factor
MMTVSTSTADDGTALVAIAGTVDETTIWELRFELSAVLADAPPKASVDMTAVHAIDAAAAALLIAFCRQLLCRGVQVVIVGMQDQPRSVFRRLSLEDDVTSAAPNLH